MSTLKAEELGMTQTRYVNPNGLPDSRQLTSARDLAILARAIMRDYPQYYSYFGLHDWNYQGREYRNTNGLLLSGQGYDGIKTGFTNASGYNLAASAVRNGKRVITIVLGGRSSPTRNAHVAALMDTGFEVENRRAAGERIQTAQTFFEARGFGIGGPDTGGAVAYAALNGAPAEVEEDVSREIIVTGTQIQGAKINDVLPVTVVDEVDIANIAATSGDELFRAIPQAGGVAFNEQNDTTVNNARGDAASINLRDLGTGNTL
eukprot:gene57873-77226_t